MLKPQNLKCSENTEHFKGHLNNINHFVHNTDTFIDPVTVKDMLNTIQDK